MKIALASDHAGFNLKKLLVAYLSKEGHEIEDLGTNTLDSVDYPDYGYKLGEEIISKDYDFGIGICGSGIGISIACNKVAGIRAALIYNKETATLAKEHNNANIICLGARLTSQRKAIILVDTFISSKFDDTNSRHLRRINKLNKEGGCGCE
ncbi:MAG: ribose 5-phosphate isomerase B [Acholeplasmatales bacterium]|jgi:ribose 5-phosphate isomerase B|nr:ribose 5-phosphate isomerase B [Acholeplasmatales bacterium]